MNPLPPRYMLFSTFVKKKMQSHQHPQDFTSDLLIHGSLRTQSHTFTGLTFPGYIQREMFMLSLGDGTMEVVEDSPPGHSIAHALPKTAKLPQWQQVALPTDPESSQSKNMLYRAANQTKPSHSVRCCCQCHRINPSRQQLVPGSTARVMWPATALCFVYVR